MGIDSLINTINEQEAMWKAQTGKSLETQAHPESLPAVAMRVEEKIKSQLEPQQLDRRGERSKEFTSKDGNIGYILRQKDISRDDIYTYLVIQKKPDKSNLAYNPAPVSTRISFEGGGRIIMEEKGAKLLDTLLNDDYKSDPGKEAKVKEALEALLEFEGEFDNQIKKST